MSQSSPNSAFVDVQTVILAVLFVAFALRFVLRRLQRDRPDFLVGRPLGVALVLRLLVIAAVASTGLNETLRGGDEETFLYYSHQLADSPMGHGFLPHGPYQLHTVVFALEIKYGSFSTDALRVMQVGIALLGMLLILAAIHDLANARAARIAAWFLAFEPGSVFFNSALHKEPLMVLASGLAVYGASRVWRNLELRGIAIAAVGGVIAVETRSYAGWFLVSGCVLAMLHAALRRLDRPLRAMPLVYAVVIAGFFAAPAVIQASSEDNLRRLQGSQDYITSGGGQSPTGSNSNNLKLERVDYSSREAILSNLPQRMYDVVFRPYPWQLSNASQRLGAIGTLVAFGGLLLLVQAVFRRWGNVLGVCGPILYPMVFLLMAYSLSAGNAGTGFRYRTHIVLLGFAMLFALREPLQAAVRGGTLARPSAQGQAVDLLAAPQGRPA
ncbi:MAG TPA: hypothetical protein VFZ89_17555 [Solirubrobacteraceae bacterium]